jgi:glycosyltransferase involved in cell wall biosynthesis
MELRDQLVSVVVPVYNRPGSLRRAVESVLQQTHDHLEIIVVDDGSTTDIGSVIRSIDDERTYFIQHEVNRGAAAARNTGIEVAQGDWVAFLDSDDWWNERKIEVQLKSIRAADPDVGVAFCGCNLHPGPGGKDRVELPRQDLDIQVQLARENCIPGGMSTPIVRNSLLREVGGFDEGYPSCQDWDLWLRLSQVCKFKFIPEPLTNMNVSGSDRISVNFEAARIGHERILNTYRDRIERAGFLADHWFRLGRICAAQGDMKAARSYLMKAIQKKPSQMYWWGTAASAFAGKTLYQCAASIKRQLS